MPGNIAVQWSQSNVPDTTFTRAAPLPRLTPLPSPSSSDAKQYEILVIGAGPAGLMMTTLLTRYGLTSTSLLCIDSRPHQTLVGNADGVNARTLEILAQLGLDSSIRRDGQTVVESAMWRRGENNPDEFVKLGCVPFMMAPARHEQLITLHQGKIERVFRDDIVKYAGNDVQYHSKLVDLKIDEAGNKEFPVLATIEKDGVKEEVRTKYIVGADGAKSAVRGLMGMEMEGDMTDELWGVMDIIADTNFPDVRRHCNIISPSGGGFIIPRERLSNGEYLTRLYLDMTVRSEKEKNVATDAADQDQRKATREKRDQIDEALILDRAAKLFYPFRFKPKSGTRPLWWAAFPISQRLTKSFLLKDSALHPRVLIVGDACHAHSPRQGQGMNVSIQDSLNLAWKLAYTLFGLDASNEGFQLLNNYEEERLPNAVNLIKFDKRMNQEGRTTEEKWADMQQFSTSCGIEYDNGLCVNRASLKKNRAWTSLDYLNGVIYPGRRLMNSRLKRFADSNMRDLHDELRSEGRFTIVMLLGDDFGKKDGRSTKGAEEVCQNVIKKFLPGLVEVIILQPNSEPEFQWADLPACIKEEAEMSIFNASEDVYSLYGIDSKGTEAGALVVARPDGVVGMMAELEETQQVVEFLERIIRKA